MNTDNRATGRTVLSINRDWFFRYFPEQGKQSQLAGAESVRELAERSESQLYNAVANEPQAQRHYDDSKWQPIGLPHTWSTFETTGELHPFLYSPSEKDDDFWWNGWGWYRKSFRLDARHLGQKCFVEFDGVMKYCQVWLNGIYIGEHKGGYASFSFDLTERLRGADWNVLAVAVSNRRNDRYGGIPPMTAGNFNVYGGIYRDVRLVVKDRLHIPFQGSFEHEGGTFVTTPQVSAETANVRVRTYVKNDYDKPRECVLTTRIVDAEGRVASQMVDRRRIAPGQLYEFDQTSEPIANPKLWSPQSPGLYKVLSEASSQDGIADQYESPLGFRYFHWDDATNRLCLNGEIIHIHGTNRHQEYPWLGDAIPKWMHDMDLQDIRFSLGHNFIRTCHYTQDKRVYELCDEIGLLVCEEAPNIKSIAFGKDIQRRQVVEMVRRDRNHPSIIMWSMGNETNCPADGSWALEQDDTRIIHYRHVKGSLPDMRHTHEQMDMENLLRCTIRGWYNADVKPLQPEIGQHTGHEEWQHDKALVDGGSQRGRIDINGVMWIYADHGADREYVNCPLKHVNPKGWVDAYRVPKYMYSLWRAHWSEQPVMFIHPYDWTSRYAGLTRNITVNSNCEYVELKVNGRSLGRLVPERANDYTVVFPAVAVERGTLTAEGIRGGEPVSHSVVMAGEPTALTAVARHREIIADRVDVTLVYVDIVDRNNVHVFGATNELRFSVSGPGHLVGPEVYRTDLDKLESYAGTMYIDTPVAIPIRSTAEAGAITVTVSSPGLVSASVNIVAIPAVDQAVETGIIELRLEDEHGQCPVEGGRRNDREPFDRKTGTSAQITDEPDVEPLPLIRDTFTDIDFSDQEGDRFGQLLHSWLCKWNDESSFDPIGYVALHSILLQHLREDKGILVADDYNFHIRHYNAYLRISLLIGTHATAPDSVQPLRQHYADIIVSRSMEVNPSEVLLAIQSAGYIT